MAERGERHAEKGGAGQMEQGPAPRPAGKELTREERQADRLPP
ncbi:MAG: hypothetical protein U0599_04105 [Vicinamibacteria bacterium]